MSRPLVFPSRVDAWLAALLVLAPLAGLYPAWTLRTQAPLAALVGLACALMVAGLTVLCVLPCRYTLEDEDLVVRAGRMTWRIPYADIRQVALSGNPLSAPALSLKRVSIVHANGEMLVSPRDREAFMAALAQRLPPRA